MDMYNRFTMLYTWKKDNIVKSPIPQKINLKNKNKDCFIAILCAHAPHSKCAFPAVCSVPESVNTKWMNRCGVGPWNECCFLHILIFHLKSYYILLLLFYLYFGSQILFWLTGLLEALKPNLKFFLK